MKKLFIAFLAAVASLTAYPRQPERGYRGFIEWSNDLRTSKAPGFNRETIYYTGAATSHGYQCLSWLYAGAGLAMERCGNHDSWILPLFADVRTDLQFGRFTPFADARIGFNMTDGGGVYFSPSIGYRFNWGRKAGVNLGVGLTVKGYKATLYDIAEIEGGYITAVPVGSYRGTNTFFTFRVGFDF